MFKITLNTLSNTTEWILNGFPKLKLRVKQDDQRMTEIWLCLW